MKWLIDEMFPPATAGELEQRGHDAVAVNDAGLAGAQDSEVFEFAVSEGRVIVTENFADYAALLEERLSRDETCVPVVFVRKSSLPSRGALPTHLDAWAKDNPDPYHGLHWP